MFLSISRCVLMESCNDVELIIREVSGKKMNVQLLLESLTHLDNFSHRNVKKKKFLCS